MLKRLERFSWELNRSGVRNEIDNYDLFHLICVSLLLCLSLFWCNHFNFSVAFPFMWWIDILGLISVSEPSSCYNLNASQISILKLPYSFQLVTIYKVLYNYMNFVVWLFWLIWNKMGVWYYRNPFGPLTMESDSFSAISCWVPTKIFFWAVLETLFHC